MFSSKEKCCLTCANWIGARKTLFQGKEAGCNSVFGKMKVSQKVSKKLAPQMA